MRSGTYGSRSDYNVRILLIGETGVGKSCLLYRYSEGEYKENFVLTHGIDYKEKNIEHMSHSIKMEIWDTTGNVKFRPLTNTCFKGVSGIILVYDVTDPNSFQNIRNWFTKIKEKGDQDSEIIIIGNKMDLINQIMVHQEEAEELAEELGVPFFGTSAKDGSNID